MQKLELFKGEEKNSPLLIIFYFLNKTEGVILAKKPYLTTYQGGGHPPILKKYKIVRDNTRKFRSLVVETAFWRKLEGGVLNKYKIWSFYGLATMQYWQKTLLDDL